MTKKEIFNHLIYPPRALTLVLVALGLVSINVLFILVPAVGTSDMAALSIGVITFSVFITLLLYISLKEIIYKTPKTPSKALGFVLLALAIPYVFLTVNVLSESPYVCFDEGICQSFDRLGESYYYIYQTALLFFAVFLVRRNRLYFFIALPAIVCLLILLATIAVRF